MSRQTLQAALPGRWVQNRGANEFRKTSRRYVAKPGCRFSAPSAKFPEAPVLSSSSSTGRASWHAFITCGYSGTRDRRFSMVLLLHLDPHVNHWNVAAEELIIVASISHRLCRGKRMRFLAQSCMSQLSLSMLSLGTGCPT